MSTPTFGSAPKKRLSNKKKLLIAGVGVAGGGLAYIWYRNRQANAAATASTDTTATDTSGIDPNTGQPYSSEAYYDPNTGQYYGLGAGGVSALGNYPLPGTQFASDNATWAQASESYLTNQGFDPATVATALGLYLAGLPLTQNQYDIVQAAIGAEGQPPNGAPSPKLIGGGGDGQKKPPKPPKPKPPLPKPPKPKPGVKVSVPNIVGMRQVQARTVVLAKGLRFRATQQGVAIGVSWIVISQQPAAGTKVSLGSTVTADLHSAGINVPLKR